MTRIKEIWLYHHSHLDVGYTHTQPALWELQKLYIDQAIELCEQTTHLPEEQRFYWTCEATAPVLKWLETANDAQVKQFAAFLKNGQICICALPMHTSPLCSAEQLAQMLYPLRELRKQFGVPIRTAINHDINGQSWMIVQVMMDAGIELYSTGINIHFGGIPLQRPRAFNWQAADGRNLLTFNGEHYSMFTQFCHLWEMNTARMKEGIDQYIERIEREGYPYDFIYISTTNIPDLDNTPPDTQLLTMIRRWNEEGHEQKIRMATPEMLLDKLRTVPAQTIATYAGDWTDYWNFGAASSAYETRLNRRSKISLHTAEFLSAQQDVNTYSPAQRKILDEVWEQTMIFDEHTWGANISIMNPDSWFVKSQWMHKAHAAYLANSLAGYAMNQQLEKLANNPLQSEGAQGVLLVNSTHVAQTYDLRIPEQFLYEGRQTSAGRFHDHLTNLDTSWATPVRGTVVLEPFSYKIIPFSQLPEEKHKADGIKVEVNLIETPFYKIHIDRKQGKITQIIEKSTGWHMLNEQSTFGFMEYVYETIDESKGDVHRKTLFPRDVEKCNNNISCWNHEWPSKRTRMSKIKQFEVKEHGSGVTLYIQAQASGVDDLEQRYTFFHDRPDIEMIATMQKRDVRNPESIYFVIPLQVKSGWEAVYDTSGVFTRLDVDQLPGVSKDWVTVDQTAAVFDDKHGVILACPDAPLVQIGDFQFGKEHAKIERNSNPLLLAWPLNNYWDTNFQASQSGKMSFKYVMSPVQSFSQERAYEAGIKAAYPIQVFPVMHCSEKNERQFIATQGEGVFVTYVKSNADQTGMMLRILNVKPHDAEIELTFGQDMQSAWYTDMIENRKTQLAVVNKRSCKVKLTSRQFATIVVHQA